MGIVSIKTVSPVSKLGIWRMTESWQELRQILELPSSEQQTLETIGKDTRKQEWLACRVLLKEMLGQNFLIGYDSERKPHLTSSDTELSISHSGAYVCVYLNERAPVGVDIQQMKPSISKGSFYFLNEEEQQWVDPENNLEMHLIWSGKEAVFKYAGDAAVDLKKHITIKQFSSNQNGLFEVNLQKANTRETVLVRFDSFEDYVLTWTI